MNQILSVTLVIILLSFQPSRAYARWATLEDAEASTEFSHAKLKIKADGTYELEAEEQVEIRNEEGRTKHGNYRLPYTKDTTELEVVEAKTINPKATLAVPDELIEDKTFASSVNGFDQINQLTIAYPGVEIGSKLYRKFKMKVKKVRFPGFFSIKEELGSEMYLAAADYDIESELPLIVEKNDPGAAVEIESTQDGKLYKVKVRLKSPVFSKVIDEKDSFLQPTQETWFVISTSKDYADLGRSASAEHEKILGEELPTLFKGILETARKQTKPIDQINTVTSNLAENVRYLGEWRTIRGAFIPRHLEEIARTRFGDCKDYSASTAAILRHLGYEADVSWVYRGNLNVPLPKLAFDSGFNHAIVWARKDKVVYWVDPTNLTSFAQGIYEDIMDRQSLIVSAKDPRLGRIPLGVPADSQFIRDYKIKGERGDEIALDASIELKGRAAVAVTGLAKRMSKAAIRYAITEAMAGERLVVSSEVPDYDLSSRIVKDQKLTGKLRIKNILIKTTAGSGFPLEFDSLKFLMDLDRRDRVSGVRLAQPVTQKSSFALLNALPIGSAKLSCSVESPWVDVSRKVTSAKRAVEVTDLFAIKKSSITNGELLGPQFEAFQKKLQDCLGQSAIIYRPLRGKKRGETLG